VPTTVDLLDLSKIDIKLLTFMFLDLFKKNAFYKCTINEKLISDTLIGNFKKHVYVSTTNRMNTESFN